jgi:hypothetical protein
VGSIARFPPIILEEFRTAEEIAGNQSSEFRCSLLPDDLILNARKGRNKVKAKADLKHIVFS